jgi:ribonuclease HI
MKENDDWYPERPPEYAEPGEFEAWILASDQPPALGEQGPSIAAFAVRRVGEENFCIGVAQSKSTSEEYRAYVAAAVGSLEVLAPHSKIRIYSHHEIIVRVVNELMSGWQKRGWRNAKGERVAAAEIYQRYWDVKKSRSIEDSATYVRKDDPRFAHIFAALKSTIDKSISRR